MIATFAAAAGIAWGMQPPGVGPHDAASLIAAVDSMNARVVDYTCEFEGTEVEMGPGDDGAATGPRPGRSYGGAFTWTARGDVRSDVYEHDPSYGRTTWKTVVRKAADGQFATTIRANDDPFVNSSVTPENASHFDMDSRCGQLDPLGRIKQHLSSPDIEAEVEGEEIDGRPMQRLTLFGKGKDSGRIVREKYWLDLARSGRVVRAEWYLLGRKAVEWDFELRPFEVDGEKIWRPISGSMKNYMGNLIREMNESGVARPVDVAIATEPARTESLRIAASTLRFNQAPAESAFTPRHNPRAPVTKSIRALKDLYGVKKPPDRPSRGEAQGLLAQRLADAEEREAELVALPPVSSLGWPWAPLAFGAASVVLASILAIRRRA